MKPSVVLGSERRGGIFLDSTCCQFSKSEPGKCAPDDASANEDDECLD